MKRLTFFFALFLPFALWASSVVMVIANKGFRDEELFVTKKVLEENGIKVTVASNSMDVARGMLGGKIKPDMLYSSIDPERFDAIVLVGGVGASVFWNDRKLHGILREFYKKGKVVAAICISPVTLARAGILRGKRATVWPSEKGELLRLGCSYQDRGVVVDGRVVTAAGPMYAESFGKAIVEVLGGR